MEGPKPFKREDSYIVKKGLCKATLIDYTLIDKSDSRGLKTTDNGTDETVETTTTTHTA